MRKHGPMVGFGSLRSSRTHASLLLSPRRRPHRQRGRRWTFTLKQARRTTPPPLRLFRILRHGMSLWRNWTHASKHVRQGPTLTSTRPSPTPATARPSLTTATNNWCAQIRRWDAYDTRVTIKEAGV